MYDELEGGLLFREQKDTGGEPSLGIKRVLRSAMVWVVVTAMLVYRSGPSTRAAAHLSSEHLFPFLSFFFFFFSFFTLPLSCVVPQLLTGRRCLNVLVKITKCLEKCYMCILFVVLNQN